MTKTNILVLFCAFSSLYFVHSAEVFDVHKYGAVSDGVHKNTAEIAKAIAAAHAAPGGGAVNFPKGNYLTGPIVLKSNVHLHLEEGAVIKFSDNFDDYLPMVPIRLEGFVLKSFSPLIYAYNQSNIGITGKGSLDGSGNKWWEYTKEHFEHPQAEQKHIDLNGTKWQREFGHQNADLIAKYKGVLEIRWIFDYHFAKPNFFQPMYSKDVTLDGVTFHDSPSWTVAPTFCEHVNIHKVTIKNPRSQVNTVGIAPDSSRHVTIANCHIDVGDDCISIKSGKDSQAREINIPTENVTISDLVCDGGASAIAIGSEMSGSVSNVQAHNIHASNVHNGILLKTCRGRGGVVENVHITNMTVTNKSGGFALQLYPFYTYGCIKNPEHKVSELTPTFRDIFITDYTASSKQGLTMAGLPEKHFSNIHLTNVHLMADEGEVITDVDGLKMTNFSYHHIAH